MSAGHIAAEPTSGSLCCSCPPWRAACWCRPASCRVPTRIMCPPCRCAMAQGRYRRQRNHLLDEMVRGLAILRITKHPASLQPRAWPRHRRSPCRFSTVQRHWRSFRRSRNRPSSTGPSIAPTRQGRLPSPSTSPRSRLPVFPRLGAVIDASFSARRASAVLLAVSARSPHSWVAVAGWAGPSTESVAVNRNDVGLRLKSAQRGFGTLPIPRFVVGA